MSLRLVSGTAGSITNSNPPPFLTGATVYPFTAALWTFATLNPSTGMAWSIGQKTVLRNALSIGVVGGVYAANADNGTQFQTVSSGVTLATGGWVWLMGRFLSTTNRWIITVDAAGNITQTQGTASVPLGAAFTNLEIGQRADGVGQAWISGYLGEAWYTNQDICLEGVNASVDATLLRQLARRGPFSVPYIADMVIDYKSLLYDVIGDAGGSLGQGVSSSARSTYYSRYPASNFNYVVRGGTTNTSSGPHPPIWSDYVLPPQTRRSDIPIPLFAPPGGGGTRTRSFIMG